MKIQVKILFVLVVARVIQTSQVSQDFQNSAHAKIKTSVDSQTSDYGPSSTFAPDTDMISTQVSGSTKILPSFLNNDSTTITRSPVDTVQPGVEADDATDSSQDIPWLDKLQSFLTHPILGLIRLVFEIILIVTGLGLFFYKCCTPDRRQGQVKKYRNKFVDPRFREVAVPRDYSTPVTPVLTRHVHLDSENIKTGSSPSHIVSFCPDI